MRPDEQICFPPIPEKYEVVPDFPSYANSKSDENPIAHISAGTRHNIAVSKSGHVYSWGLGRESSPYPRAVQLTNENRIN